MSSPEDKAQRVLAALQTKTSIAPLTDDEPAFDLAMAYRTSAFVTAARRARGETPVGWKVGFTNRTIWNEYGVHAPIYGPLYDSTVTHVTGLAQLAIGHLLEPRIEPEIVFRLKKAPSAHMDEETLIGCLDGVAHGFEIVQSIFPGWRFKAADTVAAFALHGAEAVGPFTPMPGWRTPQEWRKLLERFSITLFKDGVQVDRGIADNVLGGPLSALRHFIGEIARDPDQEMPGPGMIISTGTITRAWPVAPGECWTTRVEGLVVADMTLTFTSGAEAIR
jgi:2-oxo-3-hexenedioate decarboxylase